MHELKLQFRNYDVEIDTAATHWGNWNIRMNTVRNDMASLAFKPLFLINTILQVTSMLKKIGKDDSFAGMASIITRCHVQNLINAGKSKVKFEISEFVDLNDIFPLQKTHLKIRRMNPMTG